MKFLAVLLFAVSACVVSAQSSADGYPTETIRWDKVSAENREVIEQLFADMVLVPEGGEVKNFYISMHEVPQNLWTALMPKVEAHVDSIVIDSLLTGEPPVGNDELDTLKVEAASVADIQQFISLLRQQTGKHFRLPTSAERLLAAQFELIDTIADAADSIGKGFHLALDTIAKAEQKMLVVTAVDGTMTKYLLDGMPRVRIEKPYLIISSGMASVSLPLENLQRLHYAKATDDATTIGDAAAIEDIKVFDEKGGSERIDFSNLPADANVSIYTLDGKLVQTLRPNGRALSLPLGSLQSGIYVVKVNDVTYKIQKP